MKTYVNENGTPFEYDEKELVSIKNKEGIAVLFTKQEVLDFILNEGIWDGYHHPFDVLNIKKWIQTLKIMDGITSLPLNKKIPFRDKNGKFRSDYDIACDIRVYINSQKVGPLIREMFYNGIR